MNKKLQEASNIIRESREKIYLAETAGRDALKAILERVGEHGVSVSPLDYTDDIYIPVAEYEPQKFFPITLVRYWNGKLEVFISDYKTDANRGWEILPEGQWIDYVDANTDTWLLLDCVQANLEYADGYED